MSGRAGGGLRSPADVGYVPWLIQRVSALVLLAVLAIHVAVQVYEFTAPSEWGIYGGLLDVTLGLVLLHGFLGVRATVLESSLSRTVTTAIVSVVGLAALGLFVARVFLI